MKTEHYFCDKCGEEQSPGHNLKRWAICTSWQSSFHGIQWSPIASMEICLKCEKSLSAPVHEARNKVFREIEDEQERKRLERAQEQTASERLIALINELVQEQTHNMIQDAKSE